MDFSRIQNQFFFYIKLGHSLFEGNTCKDEFSKTFLLEGGNSPTCQIRHCSNCEQSQTKNLTAFHTRFSEQKDSKDFCWRFFVKSVRDFWEEMPLLGSGYQATPLGFFKENIFRWSSRGKFFRECHDNAICLGLETKKLFADESRSNQSQWRYKKLGEQVRKITLFHL